MVDIDKKILATQKRIDEEKDKMIVNEKIIQMNMEEYDKRVTAMYNDCWKLYRDYTKSHDMRQFNEAKDAVIKKYDRQCDVIDLVLWIAIRVQTLHDMWEREKKDGGN